MHLVGLHCIIKLKSKWIFKNFYVTSKSQNIQLICLDGTDALLKNGLFIATSLLVFYGSVIDIVKHLFNQRDTNIIGH